MLARRGGNRKTHDSSKWDDLLRITCEVAGKYLPFCVLYVSTSRVYLGEFKCRREYTQGCQVVELQG